MEGTTAAWKLRFEEDEKLAKWGYGPCCKNKKLRVTGKPVRNEAKEGIDHQRAKTARIAHVLPKARA